jgi:hypothetical protein
MARLFRSHRSRGSWSWEVTFMGDRVAVPKQDAAGHLNSITSRSAIGGGRIAAQAVGFPDRLDR